VGGEQLDPVAPGVNEAVPAWPKRTLCVVAELVIFDCDGVLVDSDRISLRIQAERISTLGLEMSYEDCMHDFLGLGMPATLRILGERLGRPVSEEWEAELDAAVKDGFRRELTPVPGIVEALEEIELPTCVASSGSHEKMRLTLGLTGLWDRFAGRIFSADEVQRGKPAPDLFLHAASRMSTPPERCVVVEDSPFGIAAAKAAGMVALGFAASTPAARFDGADAVFTAMEALPGLVANTA
jgi:HAD superfamily hydrolase (TIGR01509 family)